MNTCVYDRERTPSNSLPNKEQTGDPNSNLKKTIFFVISRCVCRGGGPDPLTPLYPRMYRASLMRPDGDLQDGLLSLHLIKLSRSS